MSNRALHGYELKALFEEQLAASGTLNFGQVYTTLERLHRDGMVEQDVVVQQERPDKKVYALTDQGRAEFEVWLKEPAPLDLDVRNQTFIKLMLARHLEGVDPLEIIKVEKQSCFARMHEVSRARADAVKKGKSLQTRLMLDLAVLRLEAFMKWLDHSEQVIQEEH